MARAAQDGLRFVPSAVEGLSAITEVAVLPDRLELFSEDKWVVIRILDIALWYRHGWLYPPARLGLGARGWPSVRIGTGSTRRRAGSSPGRRSVCTCPTSRRRRATGRPCSGECRTCWRRVGSVPSTWGA
jgi:hypothetical protein